MLDVEEDIYDHWDDDLDMVGGWVYSQREFDDILLSLGIAKTENIW